MKVRPPSRWKPPWVDRLGVAVWVTTPSGELSHLNGEAEQLLGVSARRAIGRPCHEVVGGLTQSGDPFCGANCPCAEQARRHEKLEPIELQRGPGPQWIRVLTIPVNAPDGSGPWLVHCATSADTDFRVRNYVSEVAGESVTASSSSRPALTKREAEIVRLLARGRKQAEIADELGVSYATVRNHVRNILAKFGAHSIEEAVARYLLRD